MRPGESIADRYEIVRAARSGGSAMVFEAFDRRTAQKVAVKLISVPHEPGMALRIDREVRILAGLSHPHVVGYQGSGTMPDGKMFVVLEWLSGRDLADHLLKDSLSLGAVLEIGEQVAGALAAAHAKGIVHRDIKPANVFLIDPRPDRPPDVRVIDFGVATPGDGPDEGLTRAGAILGTPAYMAPEQANYAMAVDGRADVFSLGVVLFELLTGRLPWSSRSDLARLARILTERALPVRDARADVPEKVAQCVDRMLALSAKDRPGTMEEVRDTLAACRAALRPVERARPHGVTPDPPRRDLSTDPRTPVAVPARRASLPPDKPVAVRAPLASIPPLLPAGDSQVQARAGLPLIGRKAILDRIVDTAMSAIKKRVPRTIAVVGPAGIGKTRLRTELSRALRSQTAPPVVLTARAEDTARSTPYGFLRRVLLAEAHIYPDDALDVKRAKLEKLVPEAHDVARALRAVATQADQSEERTRFTKVERWTERPSMVAAMSDAFQVDEPSASRAQSAGEEEERKLVLALLGEALDVAYPLSPAWAAARRDPRIMAMETRRSLDLVLRERARRGGLVLLVDEAHQLDRPSAEVLRGLGEVRGEPSPVVVIALGLTTLDDEPPGGRAPWVAGRVERLPLGVLDGGASKQVARLVLGTGVRADALEILVQRAGGNALYLEQLVRAVRETEVLMPGPGGELRLAGLANDAEDVERVPPTIAAAVRARLGALEADLEETLGAAAVLGEVFWVEGVASILGIDLEEAMSRLDRLTLPDFVRRRGSTRYQGTQELEFAHGVIRSVVLSRLKRPRRREMEAAAVRFLETAGEREASVLAGHLVQAGSREPAARLYGTAAERSVVAGDFAAAIALSDEGIQLCENGQVSADAHARLLEASARALAFSGDLESAERAHETLAGISRADDAVARALEHRARIALARHRFADATTMATRAVELCRSLRIPHHEATLLLAEASEAADDDRGALKALVEAQADLDGDTHRGHLARVMAGLARIALASGDGRTAESRFRGALVHSRAVHDADGLFEALVGLGAVARRAGDPEHALRYLDGAERLASDRARASALWSDRALVLAERGSIDEACAQMSSLSAETSGATAILPTLAWGCLAVGYGSDGWLDRATAETMVDRLARALEHARAEAPALAIPVQACLGHARAVAGEAERGRRESEAALLRFVKRGALRADEPWRLYLQHAAVLEMAGAEQADITEALGQAVGQLDLMISRLERPTRARVLSRLGPVGLIARAERAGWAIQREPRAHRLSWKPRDA